MRTLRNITELSVNLPLRDVELAQEFIKKRDFTSLKELVSSAIIIVKRNLRTENPKPEYLELDLDKMQQLESEIDFYLEQMRFDEDEN